MHSYSAFVLLVRKNELKTEIFILLVTTYAFHKSTTKYVCVRIRHILCEPASVSDIIESVYDNGTALEVKHTEIYRTNRLEFIYYGPLVLNCRSGCWRVR